MTPGQDEGNEATEDIVDNMSSTAPEIPSPTALLEPLESLRRRIAAVHLPLDVPGADAGRDTRGEILEQLDDHILPRLRRLDAPLLVVVGGSTGAGKSTLVNSLVRVAHATTGVRRPTTRSPVLVCHPRDRSYFVGEHAQIATPDEPTSVPAESEDLPEGVALLDTPDIDSVVDANRGLATRLVAVADLWLYVTTAARYADAVPWELLRDARERGTELAVALNRMPRAGGRDVREHLAELLAERGFGQPRLFGVPETTVVSDKLPAEAVKNLRAWLGELAGPEGHTVLGRAIERLLEGLRQRVLELARQVESQLAAAAELRDEAEASYAAALASIDEATRDGSLLRGEVLIRWQDFVGTGELIRSLQVQASWWRSRPRPTPGDMRPGGDDLKAAVAEALASAIRSGARDAGARTVQRWRAHGAGAGILEDSAAAGAETIEESAALPEMAARAAHDWQEQVLELVRREGATKRSVARIISVDLEGLALVLMVGLLGYASGAPSNGQGGTVPLHLLQAIFGADSLRRIADKARADLRDRVGSVLKEESRRFAGMVDAVDVPDDAALTQLYQATYSLEVSR